MLVRKFPRFEFNHWPEDWLLFGMVLNVDCWHRIKFQHNSQQTRRRTSFGEACYQRVFSFRINQINHKTNDRPQGRSSNALFISYLWHHLPTAEVSLTFVFVFSIPKYLLLRERSGFWVLCVVFYQFNRSLFVSLFGVVWCLLLLCNRRWLTIRHHHKHARAHKHTHTQFLNVINAKKIIK